MNSEKGQMIHPGTDFFPRNTEDYLLKKRQTGSLCLGPPCKRTHSYSVELCVPSKQVRWSTLFSLTCFNSSCLQESTDGDWHVRCWLGEDQNGGGVSRFNVSWTWLWRPGKVYRRESRNYNFGRKRLASKLTWTGLHSFCLLISQTCYH